MKSTRWRNIVSGLTLEKTGPTKENERLAVSKDAKGGKARPVSAAPGGERLKDKRERERKAEEAAKTVDPKRAAAQKAVDAALTKAIDGTPMLKDYLRSLFTLRKGQYPHEMVF